MNGYEVSASCIGSVQLLGGAVVRGGSGQRPHFLALLGRSGSPQGDNKIGCGERVVRVGGAWRLVRRGLGCGLVGWVWGPSHTHLQLHAFPLQPLLCLLQV